MKGKRIRLEWRFLRGAWKSLDHGRKLNPELSLAYLYTAVLAFDGEITDCKTTDEYLRTNMHSWSDQVINRYCVQSRSSACLHTTYLGRIEKSCM
jgi:hypothetical protein